MTSTPQQSTGARTHERTNCPISTRALAVRCLVVGTVTTLGFAVVPALIRSPLPSMSRRAIGANDEGPGYAQWAVTKLTDRWGDRVLSDWARPDTRRGGSGVWPSDSADPLVPSWAAFLVPPQEGLGDAVHACAVADARGWPARALSGGFVVKVAPDMRPTIRMHGAIVVGSDRRSDISRYPETALVVIGPVWSGLLLDIVVFGLAWGAVECGIWSIRAMVHRSRGLHGRCPRCGYTSRGLERCPECGAPVSASGVV